VLPPQVETGGCHSLQTTTEKVPPHAWALTVPEDKQQLDVRTPRKI
jgi:hypothetical protein